jgi:glycosyltransferase involved in cell wall biosynthesis
VTGTARNSGGPRRRLMLYSDAVTPGGAEASAGHLLSELPERFEVVVAGVDARVAETIASRRPGTPVEVVERAADKRDLSAIAAHVRLMRRVRPDILHVNLFSPWNGQYAQLAGIVTPGVTTVTVEHLPMPWTHRRQRLAKRALTRCAAAHVAVGDRAAREIEQLVGLPRGTMMTIHNGVPDVAVEPVEPVEPPASRPVIGSLGRLSEQKSYGVLIRALPELPDANLVLVGDGPERPALERLAEDLGVRERLHITGWTDSARAHLGYFDVFALVSHYEAFPLAILEAMLAEVPVVATDVGSVAEAVHDGETGLLVPPRRPADVARAIGSLLSEPERASALARNARRLALERFTASAMAERYVQLYDRLLSRR